MYQRSTPGTAEGGSIALHAEQHRPGEQGIRHKDTPPPYREKPRARCPAQAQQGAGSQLPPNGRAAAPAASAQKPVPEASGGRSAGIFQRIEPAGELCFPGFQIQ